MCFHVVFWGNGGVARLGIVTYIIVGFAVDEGLPLLDAIGMILLLIEPSSPPLLNPVTLRTTLMFGVGTFVNRVEGWYVTYCLFKGNGGEGEGEGGLTEDASKGDSETSK